MAPACSAAAPAVHRVSAPVPVAWLEGDVLAEYLLFLEETVPQPPPAPSTMGVPVVWLEGEARDEFLRFLEESRAKEAAAGVGLEEEHGSGKAMRDGGGGDGGDDGGDSVRGLFMEEEEEDAGAMKEDDESGGVCVEKHEQEAEAVLEMLMPHILDLPAFRARAAAPAPVQQEPVLGGFPCYHGGWMQNRVSSFLEVDSCTSSSSSDEEMSSAEDEFGEGASLGDQKLASESIFRHSCTF
jgi:hypothetical protein